MLPKGLLKEHWRAIALLMRFVDMVAFFLAGRAAYILKFGYTNFSPHYLLAMTIGIAFIPVVFSIMGIYHSIRGKGFVSHSIHLFQSISVLAVLLAGLAFFTKSGEMYSRLWFLIWMGLTFGFLVGYRCMLILFLRFMRSQGLNERRIVILGAGELGIKFAATVQQALWTGFRIVTFLDDDIKNKPQELGGIPLQQTPANLGEFLIEKEVDEIWLALPLRAEKRVREILHELRHFTITTRFLLDIFSLDLLNHSVTNIAGFPVINIRSTPMMGINRIIKAIEDRFMAALILCAISPILLLIALGVKLTSKGPVFFRQKRLGWDGRIIKVYKFRTMYLHDEKSGCVTQATSSDPRITPFGRFLRRTSLDELPQFINVLQGRMSIVGPRPHALAHNEQYKDTVTAYMQRHRVKPGITGWAQINGWRGETDTLNKMKKRVEYDLYYINNWSLGFDLKIIFFSLFKGFINRNAY